MTSDKIIEEPSVRNNEDLHRRLLADVAHDLSGEVNFPTSLDLAIKMRNTFKNPEVSAAQLVRTVAMEPLIASKLMRLANSPEYNASGHDVTDLPSAIDRLGRDTARTTSLAVAMDQIMKSRNLACFDHFAQLTWEHSLRTAAIARALARHTARFSPEEAMLAGLVHDIGIYYLFYRASEYAEYRENKAALIELVLGWHESIGESVLNALGFAEKLVDAVRDHDCPRLSDNPPRSLNDVVYIANLLAGSNWEWLPNTITPGQAAAMEKTRERYAFLLEAAEEEIRELHAALAN